MAPVATATANPDDQLAWEARQRPRAAVAAVLGGVFALGADLVTSTVFRDAPSADFLRSLREATAPGPVGSQPSARTAFLQYYADHQGVLIGAAVVRAVAYVGIGWALTFLAAAVRARRENFPRAGLYIGLIGAVLQAVSVLMGTLDSALSASDFLDGPRTVDAAHAATSGSLLVTANIIGLPGLFALAAGFVLVSLNAMRCGLLTRFMGTVGMLVGVLAIIPIGPLPIVQAFWLLALGVIMTGRAPGGLPPAWSSGRAEPWPDRAPRRSEPRVVPAGPDPEPPRVAHPGAARRKRKRRA